jgi:SPOR domain
MSEQVDVSGPMYRPSRDDDHGMDPGTLRLLYFAAFGGLAILAGVAVYTLTARSGGDALPVIQAAQGPLKVKPENPGGMAVLPEAKIANPAESRLAPPTEEPNPRALAVLGTPSTGALPVPPAPPRAKSITVQLAATKSEAEAQAAWARLTKRVPDLARHPALFQKTNEPGATAWRLRTSGFADPAQAKSLCEKVKAKGGQCSVVES